ncbi:MAG: Universal stress protein [Calditrichaeota bacterium]|nr:Universal stress protein [Calditrichota bacterium]
MKIRKILFPTDYSTASNRALDHALVLAHLYRAELIMLHVEVPYGSDPYNPKKEFPDLDELFTFIREHVQQRVDDEALPVITGDIRIREVVKRGISDAGEILEFVESEQIDLIVMGTHGRGAISHLVLGSTTEKVVRGSLVPVLTIRHGEDLLITNQGRYRRILVPVDFSDARRGSLKFAVELAEQFEAELMVTHVFEPVLTSPALFADAPSTVDIDTDLRKRSVSALEKFAGNILPEGTPFKLRSGQVHREINALAKQEDIDLIVIANQGWSALDRWLLGGTTEKVIRRSPVPVMIKPYESEPDENRRVAKLE